MFNGGHPNFPRFFRRHHNPTPKYTPTVEIVSLSPLSIDPSQPHVISDNDANRWVWIYKTDEQEDEVPIETHDKITYANHRIN